MLLKGVAFGPGLKTKWRKWRSGECVEIAGVSLILFIYLKKRDVINRNFFSDRRGWCIAASARRRRLPGYGGVAANMASFSAGCAARRAIRRRELSGLSENDALGERSLFSDTSYKPIAPI